MKRHLLILFLTLSSGATAPAKPATQQGPAPLMLQGYLEQVSTKHLGLKASDQIARAARQESGEGRSIFFPTLLGNGNLSSEGRSNPLAPDNHFAIHTYSLGVSEATPIGVNGKLTYNFLAVPGNGLDYNTGYYQLDLSASLLRNFWGGELGAQSTLLEAGALAKSFAQSHATKSLLLEAEANYWRLALAREMVAMQRDAVDRAQKISDWTQRRVRLQLADRSEVLQARTNLQARLLDKRTADDEERAASLAFNSSRGILGAKVDDRLIELTPDLIQRMTAPERSTQRDDVRSAEQQSRAARATAEINREKNKPTLEVYSSSLLTDPTAPTGLLATMLPISARPMSSVGVKLSAPLDVGTLSKAREGYAAEAMAADWQYQRKVFEEERDWQDLTAKFTEAKARFQLFTNLEQTQREKLDYERDRHTRGRSTLQQVLLFESDFENSQLGRLRTLAELLTLNAQMKLYGVSYESR